MTNKQVHKRCMRFLVALLLLVASVVSGRGFPSAYADTATNTSVLADLQMDSAFTVDDYPDNAEDYGIQVVQIAESKSGELFVYTYQPCQKTKYLIATEVNMSLSESVNGTKLYSLTLLNCEGTLCKYIVNDFIVSTETVRYYNITSIYRTWDKDIDKATGNDNTKNAVAFAVGRLYEAETKDGAVSYSCRATEVVQIINPVAGYLEYSNGFKFFPDWCHSHYVAFSTDKQIDMLMEADVSYISREASSSTGLGLSGDTHYKNEQSITKTIKGTEKGGNVADGYRGKKYEWERIQTVKQFKADKQNALTDSAKEKLDGQQWVLRFVETEIHMTSGYGTTTTFWTDISNVTILRLKFVTHGKVYNLGAVSDKVTEGDKPDNTNTNEHASFWEWLARKSGLPEWFFKLLAIIIPLAILLPVLSIIFPVVGQVLAAIFKGIAIALLWLLKGLWWLVCLPFRGIAALVRKIKERKGGGE